jgi:hypothetical protein
VDEPVVQDGARERILHPCRLPAISGEGAIAALLLTVVIVPVAWRT